MGTTSKIAGFIVAAVFLTSCAGLGDRYVGFAQCLTDKKVVMYGAYWCPSCAKQKKLFGNQGFKKVTYVECDARGEGGNPQLCIEKKIEKYPTWDFSDGSRLVGVLPLEQLSEKTGCPLPKENEETK